MGHVKRSPQLATMEHKIAYERMSKADIVEAYRDLFRELGGVNELDDIEWMNDLRGTHTRNLPSHLLCDLDTYLDQCGEYSAFELATTED